MINILSALIGLFTCGGNDKNKDDIDEMKRDIHTIKTNHLHHLEFDVSEIKTDIKLMNQYLTDIKISLSKLS